MGCCRTWVSGILPEHLKSKDALTLEEAQEKVRAAEHVLTARSVAVFRPSEQYFEAGGTGEGE